jgi:mRNA interferase MazF
MRTKPTGQQIIKPSRGEVWYVDLEPVEGHEQGKVRPCVVVSANEFNKGPYKLAFVVPVSSTKRNFPFHVEILPPEGGVTNPSYAMCEATRSASTIRFIKKWGVVKPNTLKAIEDRLRILLRL